MPALMIMAATPVILSGRSAQGQTQRPLVKSIVGTVTAFKPESPDLEVKPDNAPPVSLKLTDKTLALRVAPGEKDLKKAESIAVADLSVGDRVLVTLDQDGANVRRVIVMSLADITKRNDKDRQDWVRRGVTGIVAAKDPTQITLKMRTMQGPVQAIVTVDEHTKYKRYAPDSVKFSDAKVSNLDEIQVGDQLRARGQKSEDGLKVTAEDVVFGTFLTKAGSVASVNSQSGEITIKELGSGKPLVIKLTADSQIKKMPDFGGATPGGGQAGSLGGGQRPAEGGSPAGAGFRGAGAGAGGHRDVSQMIERMPAGSIGDLKPGDTIVVSSTKGTQSDQVTAIMLIANAEMLIRMASPSQGGNRGEGGSARGAGGGMGMGQMEGLGGFELPGITP